MLAEMDEFCDLQEICDVKPFDEIHISTDDDEPVPQISAVCSIRNDALPMASKDKYNRVYQEFENWQKKRKVSAISEPLLLEYFQELSVKQKPTSLWAGYSMLKRTLKVNLNTDISSYDEVLSFLKTFSSGYEPVKSKSFTEKDIVKFIVDAPDDAWLDVKTVCIFAICGSLKLNELRSVNATDVEQHGDILLVKVEDSSTKAFRSFTITGKFCSIVKKYMALRPPTPVYPFFLNYQRRKCTIQPIGKNKMARMPQRIAQYLSLPEPDRYTGQAFRLSAQNILKNTTQTVDNRIMDTIEHTYSSRSNTTQSGGRVEHTSHDTDCKSEYEETVPETEGRFCTENLLKVDNLRLHCTTCDTHIGCAVANEGNVRSHPILFVTQCKNCHTYYNKRDFTKGEDGSELQCRWCAQGGEVYSCSKCPYVFCRKCILQNLSKNVITEIERNNDWQCFSCSPNFISHLRAQHWALTNHIRQTKNQIREMKDADQLYKLMQKDQTLCCRGKEPLNSRQHPKDSRRPRSNNSDCSAPEPKRIRNNSLVCIPIHLIEESRTPGTIPLSNRTTTTVTQKSVNPPPLISRESPSEASPLTIRPVHSISSARPTSPLKVIDLPLNSSLLQNVAFPNSQLPIPEDVTSPGYQTYNILVDLATKEDTFVRLPNGKLIQFRPQSMQATEPAHQTMESTPPVLIQNCLPHATKNLASSAQSSLQILNVSQQDSLKRRQPLQPQQPFHQKHQRQIVQQSNGIPDTLTAAKPQKPQPTVTQYPNSPLGQAQTELEKDIHGTHEICQQIIAKCNALMKSKAYNSVQNYNDVRDLHQHLSYLFTYAIGRFTTLKSKTTDTMKLLTNAYVAAKKLEEIEASHMIVDDDDQAIETVTGYVDDDDVQVIETVTECIEIDSDDETEPKENYPPVDVENNQTGKTSHQVKSKNQSPTAIVNNTDNEEFELPIPHPLDTVKGSYDRENDEKLKGNPIVVLKRNENIEQKLQKILERQKSENDFASPVADENETNSAHKLVSNEIVGEDHDRNVEMQNSEEDERHNVVNECTKSDRDVEDEEFKVIDRDKYKIDVRFDNSTDVQNEDQERTSVDGSVNNFNLSYLQSSQITGYAEENFAILSNENADPDIK